MTEREKYFFFGHQNPCSNWHMRDFVVRDIVFPTNEAFLMYCKAKVMGDEITAKKILATYHPKEHKALGRQVRPFDGPLWNAKREHYAFVGALAKFRQNEDLGDHLVSTYPKQLVEASPYDRIWGCGLDEGSPAIHHQRLWPGLNLLGPVLEKAREVIMIDRGLSLLSFPTTEHP